MIGPTPRIDGRPISALTAAEVRDFVVSCDDRAWLRSSLEWELQAPRPRDTVIKAMTARLMEVF